MLFEPLATRDMKEYQRRYRALRFLRKCKNGHQMSERNTYSAVVSKGARGRVRVRYCKKCRNAWSKVWRAAHPGWHARYKKEVRAAFKFMVALRATLPEANEVESL